MVARPDAVDGLVEDPLAGGDLERRPAVLAAADEDVVEPPEGPVPVGDERILGRGGLAGLARMDALPRVAIADARAVQRLAARDEADVRGVGVGGEVARENDVDVSLADQLLEEAHRREGLQLALALKLPARDVVREAKRG